jgi:hypothetical protein
VTSKNDLVQILRHMAEKHRSQLGITHVPIPLGMLDEVCEALQVETSVTNPRWTCETHGMGQGVSCPHCEAKRG